MSEDLVLVTGASGFLGFRIVVNALEHGYGVRAAVRSQAKADSILAAPSIQALAPGPRLTFALIPDIAADSALDEAVKNVSYIAHTASPLAPETDDYERDVINPAVKGTIGVLESAARSPSVKRIVITSSITAVIPFKDLMESESETIYTPNSRYPDLHPPFHHPWQAYGASKANALNATDRFTKTSNPAFTVINIIPGFLIGRNELITSSNNILSGTNEAAFAQILGQGQATDFPYPGATVHVDDVAKLHILSLDPKIQGGRNFGCMSGGVGGTKWEDAIDIVKRRFPEAVKDGRLPANGVRPSKRLLFDASETERVFGMVFRSYEEQVVDVALHYLELIEREKDGGDGHV